MNKSRSRGFTLIELMVVLVVATVLLTIGIPSFRSVIANQRASTAINEALASFRLARSEAIKTARSVTVCKSEDGATCEDAVEWEDGWIVFVNTTPGTPDTVDAGDQIIRVNSGLPGELTLTATGDMDAFLSFRPTGSAGTTVQNLRGTLTLCDPDGIADMRALNITASGSTNVSYDTAYDGVTALACP
jgi:type IV fimbrial biogenesis protein FimT